MTLLERARALMNQTTGAALVAMPLAAAVASGPAAASVTLPTSGVSKQVITPYVDLLSIQGSALSGGGTSFMGGSRAVTFASGGRGRIYQQGLLNESYDGAITLDYNFRLEWWDVNQQYTVTPPSNWSIVLSVSQTGGSTFQQTITSSNGLYQGSSVLNAVHLDANRDTQVSFAMNSNIGNSSVDLNLSNGGYVKFIPGLVPAVTPVPEPETWALFGGGLLMLLARRRRT